MSNSKKQNTEFLIIGFGLAGALIALNLEQQGCDFVVINSDNLNQASITGAGIINPLIGKNLNLSWKFEKLLTSAQTSYEALETIIQDKVFFNYPLIRIINSPKQLAAYQNLTDSEYIGDFYEKLSGFRTPHGAFLTNQAHWLDTGKLINLYQTKLQSENKYFSEEVQYSNLKISAENINYQNITAKQLIFCDGYQASLNPLAKFMEFRPAKGEIIDLKIPTLNNNEIYNFGNFLLPLGNNHYRLGATYSWSDFEKEPVLSKDHELLATLDKYLLADYEILAIKSAIRPIVSGRLPVIGSHPKYQNISFFNGLGSRGSLQAPYCAKQLVESITENKPIDSEISTARFYD